MHRECCPECGHMLSKNRSVCPFCGWDENSDQYNGSPKVENDLSYLDFRDVGQNQFPRF